MTALTLPVTQVLVMEDRAQVERSGSVELEGGLTRLEVAGLSPVAVDRSLRVEVHGGTLVDAKIVRRYKEQPPGVPADASALRRGVDELERAVGRAADEVTRLEQRGALLASAREDLLRAIAEHTGHGRTDVSAWTESLATLSSQQAALDERLRLARKAHAREEERLAEACGALSVAEGPTRVMECTLAITVEGQGKVTVRASYLVPCALWRPAYRATLDGTTVLVEAEAVVWQRTEEDWHDAQLRFSTARPTLGTSPPTLQEDVLHTRPKEQVEKKVVQVDLREETIQTTGEGGGGAELPGLDDGGEARLLEAPARSSVPSDGQPHRVPLFSFEAAGQLEHVCTPELSSLVFVLARFENTSGRVLLSGPVDLVRRAGLVGRSTLSFAAPGERVKLSFGNEDGMQVQRELDEQVDEARLTGTRTRTKKLRYFVSNMRSEPAHLVLEERIIVSEVSEVTVKVLTKDCDPQPASISKDGIARLELQLAPHAIQSARFAWEVTASGKVAGI